MSQEKQAKMKILTLCMRGNSRSVALSYYLKEKLGHESIAAGMTSSSRETRKMLYEWADLIILVIGDRCKHWIPEEYWHKLEVWNVGRDVYFRKFDNRLMEKHKENLKRIGLL